MLRLALLEKHPMNELRNSMTYHKQLEHLSVQSMEYHRFQFREWSHWHSNKSMKDLR